MKVEPLTVEMPPANSEPSDGERPRMWTNKKKKTGAEVFTLFLSLQAE